MEAHITREEAQKWASGGRSDCPRCGCPVEGEAYEPSSVYVTQHVHCTSCTLSWEDVLVLGAVRWEYGEDEEPRGEEDPLFGEEYPVDPRR